MSISIVPFTEEWIAGVEAFNRRMVAGCLKPEMVFPASPAVLEYPTKKGLIWQEPFLAVEDGAIRGGYYFTHERYVAGREIHWIAHFRHPISEVVINKAYKGLTAELMADASKRQPNLYCLGYGGTQTAVARRLRASGWSEVLIPFWFRVFRPAAFFRNLAFFRKARFRRLVCDLAAATGLGWVAIKAVQSIRTFGGSSLDGYAVETVPEFGTWADELWEINRSRYILAAVRDCATLNLRYPPENPRFIRLAISQGGRMVGWAILLEKQMGSNPYFGCMRVGTVVDCLASPGCEPAVAQASADRLEAAGADIVISNQSALGWQRAFRGAGFLSGPSNYPLAVSQELAGKLDPVEGNVSMFHITRGDGAGISRL